MKTLLLATVAVCALAGTAQAQRFTKLTGEQLVTLCNGKQPVQVQSCEAYIAGIGDTLAFYQRLRPSDGTKGDKLPAYVCIAPEITGPQLRQAVVDFAGKHKDQLGRQASGIVLRALDAAYLCPGEQRRIQE